MPTWVPFICGVPSPQPVSSPTSFPHPLLTLFVALLLGELNGEA